MANGFNVVSLSNVDVQRAEEVAFRFNLVRLGSGYTLPERRNDRSNPRWRILANRSRRTIYQNNEGTGETVAEIAETVNENVEDTNSSAPSGQNVLATYLVRSNNPYLSDYTAINFATQQPINDNLELVFVGQTGIGQNAMHRVETGVRLKLDEQHRLRFNLSGTDLGIIQKVNNLDDKQILGQLSLQAFDEWQVKDGIIIVLGLDYSRFVGASSAASIAPRVGLQFDANAKTRFSAAYTVQNEQRTWQQAAELEDNRISFSEPKIDLYAVADKNEGKQFLMPRLRRLEFGIERVLDNASSLEATAFFDATTNRGISFVDLPIANLVDNSSNDDWTTAVQNGSAQGVRLIYARRLNSIFSTSLGYAAGRGQRLTNNNLSNPADLFENSIFQTLAAQVSADFKTGTNVQTIWRYSPDKAVFAIDPFAGRMTVFDPSLSVLVTQDLPRLGLPIRAKAIFDARNLFDFQTAINEGESVLRLNSNQRILRGGIAVRF
jgi:hypothetical protein